MNNAPKFAPSPKSKKDKAISQHSLSKEQLDSEQKNTKPRYTENVILKKEELSQSDLDLVAKNNQFSSSRPQSRQQIEFLFEPKRDTFPYKPYFMDGNPEMYTEEMVEVRNSLKDDPQIKKAIQKFSKCYKFNFAGALTKEDYLEVHREIALLLRDDLSEELKQDEFEQILEQDWEHDADGSDLMTYKQLYNSLFELVDIWTPDAEKEEYLEFFEILTELLQQPKQKQNKQQNKTGQQRDSQKQMYGDVL